MNDVIVIGGGGAACSAAIYAVRAGLKVALVTEMFGGQLLETEFVENYPGTIHASGMEISKMFEEHVKEYKEIEIVEGFKAVKIEGSVGDFKVELSNGKQVEGKSVIIATGKRAKKLKEIGVKGAEEFEGKGIHYCATCDGPLYKEKQVAVIGGGYVGIEEALFLSDICEKVFLLEYSGEIGGEEITRKKVLEKENVEVLTGVELSEVFGEQMVSGVKYKGKDGEKRLEVSAVFAAVGENTNSEWFEGKKNDHGEIVIDENNMSSVEGVFAAGDVSDIKVKQLVVSAAEGCKAALGVNAFLKKK